MNPTVPSKEHILRRVYQMAAGRRDTRLWDEAWEHIKAHLSQGAGGDKAAHAVFNPSYRTREAVAELIMQASSKPSDTEDSFLTGPGGQPTGGRCLIIRRWFNKPIGSLNGAVIDTLWVIADYEGKLITAYPRVHPKLGK